MIRIKSQMPVFEYNKTIIELESCPPSGFQKLVIDGVEYEPQTVYGLRPGYYYGIEAKGDFVGKEVNFK